LAWRVEFDDGAKKDLSKIDKEIARRITAFLLDRVAVLNNPRTIGAALKGSKLGDFWRYRIGDYRLICSLEDDVFLVLVLKIGHRREVYR